MKKLLIVLFALLFGTISFSRIAQSTEIILYGDTIDVSTGEVVLIDGDSGDVVIVDGDNIDVSTGDVVIIDDDSGNVIIIDGDSDDVVIVDGYEIDVSTGDVVIIDGSEVDVITGDVVIVSPDDDDPTTIYMDIKPGSCKNSINIKSKGVLPVAILGTSVLSVEDIDPVSIRLAGVAPLRSSVEDVATPEEGEGCNDYAPDGFDDLVLKFDTQEIVNALGEVADGKEGFLPLTGTLHDGSKIQGEDAVIIKKKGKGKGKK